MHKKRGRKGLKIVIIVIVGFVLLLGASVAGGIALMQHTFGDRTEIMQTMAADPERALVVYQPSVTSAASDTAYAIARGLNDAGFEVTLNTPGAHLSTDISRYSVFVFGSTNYGGSPGQAMLDYMHQLDDVGEKRLLLFSTSGSTEGRLEFDKMEAALRGTKPYDTIKLAVGDIDQGLGSAYQFGFSAGAAG